MVLMIKPFNKHIASLMVIELKLSVTEYVLSEDVLKIYSHSWNMDSYFHDCRVVYLIYTTSRVEYGRRENPYSTILKRNIVEYGI